MYIPGKLRYLIVMIVSIYEIVTIYAVFQIIMIPIEVTLVGIVTDISDVQ